MYAWKLFKSEPICDLQLGLKDMDLIYDSLSYADEQFNKVILKFNKVITARAMLSYGSRTADRRTQRRTKGQLYPLLGGEFQCSAIITTIILFPWIVLLNENLAGSHSV